MKRGFIIFCALALTFGCLAKAQDAGMVQNADVRASVLLQIMQTL